jgi:diguanylate cyclase (GGDEF)-like protein
MVSRIDPQQARPRGGDADAPLLVVADPRAGRRRLPPGLREALPFLLVAVGVALLIPGTTLTLVGGAVVLTALAICRGYGAVRDLGPRARLLPPVLLAISIGTLAAISGEPLYDVILCFNVLLVALQEDRRSLLITLGVTLFALAIPAILHPDVLGLRAVVWAILAPVLSLPVQRRSEELRKRVSLGPKLRTLQASMLATGDSREALVRATPALASCDAVLLVEPDSSGRFVITTASRDDMVGVPIPDDERSLVLRAVKEHRPIFVPDVFGATGLVPELSAEFGEISSWLSAPVARGGFVAAVLCVGWIEPVRNSDDLRIDIVRSLASEASTTIDHTDLLRTLSDNASSDELTGLINRRGWDSLYAAEMDAAKRRQAPLSVAIIDLDHFKHYNDINGHRAGDRLLREAAGSWTAALRAGDRLARWGGEEFTILLPDCTGSAALEVVERVRAATPGDQTCSAGIASWDGIETAISLFERMDRALYEAKTSGRDSSVLSPHPFPNEPVKEPSSLA